MPSTGPQPRHLDGSIPLPGRFPNPFNEGEPAEIAKRACEKLQDELRQSAGPVVGKMFGILVVESEPGEIGFLQAFSGMWEGRWERDGFVPPMFDAREREAVEVPGEEAVKKLLRRYEEHLAGEEYLDARRRYEEAIERIARERAGLQEEHRNNREERKRQRASASAERSHALDQESRGDKAAVRRLAAQHARLLEIRLRTLQKPERRATALERLRKFISRRLMQRIHDTYRVTSVGGEARQLRSFYEGEPPSGAGDCAAPKLLAYAISRGWKPIALAEFWWGPPPPGGGRVEGKYYGACRDKCGPLLPFLLEGLEVEEGRPFVVPASAGPGLRILHEDRQIVVIDKPEGLLSVPGRDEGATDSVLTRLKARYPGAEGPLLVHRLDLDTSGVIVAALDPGTHKAVQQQFAKRHVTKRYVAWVDGVLTGEEGTIDLAIRVDLEDRPRQIHDPEHGKGAVTDWKVLERRENQTKIAFSPRSGRTHQLRVHAAHPQGLGAAIVGDRLYGRDGPRLLLHAESITFVHPGTGQPVTFESPAPF